MKALIGRRRLALLVAVMAAAVALGGCENTRRAFGLVNSPPDEFVVVSRAPLSLPPDFKLRPPRPGTARPNETDPVEVARQTVFGLDDKDGRDGGLRLDVNAPLAVPVAPVGVMTPGEALLLARAGADAAQANIREIVDREGAAMVNADETFLDRILNWREPALAGTIVDAQAEAKRLRENQALGQLVTEGKTPSITRKRRGLLEGLINF